MAFTLADAVVLFKGDDSPLTGALDKTKGALTSWGGTATKLIGGAVLGGATIAAGAIAAIGTAAFDVSKQTDQAAADMAASLGIPRAEAEKFADVARQVYGNNFANDVGDAADAVTALAKTMQLSADDPALQQLTENAFRLRDAFGVDVTESVDAAKTLMDNFGISGDEAFSMIAAGYQKGLDRSGDFLDTIGEYSVQFSAGGATASQFFGLLDSGLQGGMLGTDKAADAFKEFRVRIADGSKTTADALSQIGINVDDLTAGMSDGTITAADAFTIVQSALNETADPVTRMQAGVGLLGTQYEDLGDQVANALTLNDEWAKGTEGSLVAIDQKYTTFGSAVEGIWRRLTVSVSPFTDKLIDLVNEAMPSVMAAFDTFDNQIVPALTTAFNAIGGVIDYVKGLFAGLGTATTDGTAPMGYWASWVEQNMPRIQQIIEAVLGGIQTFWAAWGDTIMTILSNTFDTVFTIFDTAFKTMADIITLFLQLLTGDWEGAGETLIGIVTRLWDTIWHIFSNQLDSIISLFTNNDWAGAGAAIVNGVKDGIEGAWEGLIQWFSGRLEGLRNLLPFSEPKDASSPLRGLGQSGASLVRNVRSGMEAELGKLSLDFATGLSRTAFAAGGGGGSNITVAPGAINVSIAGTTNMGANEMYAIALRAFTDALAQIAA